MKGAPPDNKNKKIYDLEEHTARFGEAVIVFAQKIPRDAVTVPIITQFVKAGTSIGANYCEADCAESRRDFEHKIGICKKEARETRYWLRMIGVTVPNLKDEGVVLLQEAHELQLIFITIVKNSKNNSAAKE